MARFCGPGAVSLPPCTTSTVATASRVMPIIELSPRPPSTWPSSVRQMPPAHRRPLAVDLGAIADPDDPLCSPPLDLAEELAGVGVAHVAGAARVRQPAPAGGARPGRPHAPEAGGGCSRTATRTIRRPRRRPPPVCWPEPGLEADRVDLVIDLAETACTAHANPVRGACTCCAGWRSAAVALGHHRGRRHAGEPRRPAHPTSRSRSAASMPRSARPGWSEPGINFADYGVTSPVRRLGITPPAAAHPAVHRRSGLVDLPFGASRRPQRRPVPRPLPHPRRLAAVAGRRGPLLLG